MISTPTPSARRPRYRPVRFMQQVAVLAPIAYLLVCGIVYFYYGQLAWLVIGTLTIYLAGCAAIFLLQNGMTYPRTATGALLSTEQAVEVAAKAGLVPWAATTPGAIGPQGYVRPDFESPTERGTIVVFHGNGGWSADREGYVEIFFRRGFRTFLYEYPGYGGRPGRPGEAAIVPDAQAVIRALDAAGYGPIYAWGESLGSGVAAAVCADPHVPVRGLVLLTPWDTIANVGRSIYPYIPARLIMKDIYNSIANLERFPHPVCVVRCEHDEVIPPALTLNLIAHLRGLKKVILHGDAGHEDWPNAPELAWWDEALDFIAPREDHLSQTLSS